MTARINFIYLLQLSRLGKSDYFIRDYGLPGINRMYIYCRVKVIQLLVESAVSSR